MSDSAVGRWYTSWEHRQLCVAMLKVTPLTCLPVQTQMDAIPLVNDGEQGLEHRLDDGRRFRRCS